MLSRIFLLVVMVCVGTAAVYLAPGTKELALMEMEDSNYHDSLAHYTRFYEAGDRSVNIVGPLIKLYIHYGQPDKAIFLLQSVVKDQRYAVEGRKQLAQLYRISQRFHAYCTTLEELQELEPSAATLRELADTYDFMGDYRRSAEALARLVKVKDYEPREDDYYALASYYYINGKPDDALAAALPFIRNPRSKASVDMVDLALYMLLEQRRNAEAFDLASLYLRQNPQEQSAVALSHKLELYGKTQAAMDLLAPFMGDPEDRSPGFLQQLVTLQGALGKEEESYALLSRLYGERKLPGVLIPWLIDFAIDRQQYALAEELMRSWPLETVEESVLLRYAAVAAQARMPKISAILKARLAKDRVTGMPLLSALLDVGAKATPQSMARLLALEDSIPTPEHKALIAGIYAQNGYPVEAHRLLEGVPFPTILEALDPLQLAQIYLLAGAAEEAMKQLDDVLQAGESVYARQALFLLAAGTGDMPAVHKVLAGPKKNYELLDAGYILADRYRHPALALTLAENLYEGRPSQPHRVQLAQALLLSRRYDEALHLFAQSVKEAPQTQAMQGLTRRLQEHGIAPGSDAYFLSLMSPDAPLSPEVGELVSWWYEHLPQDASGWMEDRARKAQGAEQITWLEHFNALNRPRSVIAVLQGRTGLPQPVADEYIEALASARASDALSGILRSEIAGEEGERRLTWLTRMARQNDLPAVSVEGFRKLYTLNPGNLDATRELALAESAASHYTEAEKLMEQYMRRRQGDYRIDYSYGELLQRQGEKAKAQEYFRKAYAEVSKLKDKDKAAWSDQARLLYRTHREEEAVKLFNSLMLRYPGDADLRADFAETLIAAKRFDEASLVLAP